MHILITGAAGFLGRNLATRLAAAGHHVDRVDDLSVPPVLDPPPGLRRLDVRALTARDLTGVDTVMHFAARKNVPDSFTDRTQMLHNVDTDHALLELATLAPSVRRILLASSCEVYGDRGGAPCAEHHPTAPRSPYAVGKLATEALAAVYRQLRPDTQISCLRLHNIYGPDEGPDAVVPAFLDAAAGGRPLVVEGNGQQARDLTHIDDAVTMIARVCADPRPLPPLLNIGSGVPVTVLHLAHAVLAAVGGGRITHLPARPNEITVFTADTTLFHHRYGPPPTRPLSHGIASATAARLREIRQPAALPTPR